MAEIFITLDEAAELEGIAYEAMKKKLQRCSDEYSTKTEPSVNGGKDRLLILLDSLSKKAIRAYQVKQQTEIRKFIDEVESKDGEDAWYVGVDYNWYIHNYKEKFYQMVDLARNIEEYLDYRGEDKTEYTEQFAMRLGMSGRNLRRKVDKYLEGLRWAVELQAEDGKNYEFYKILALCPPPKRGGYIALTEEMKATIENIWFDKMFAANHRKQTKLYTIFTKKGEEKGWLLMPSYQTVNRYINDINDKYSNERYLADQGEREFKRNKMMKRRRNTGVLQVMELVQGDAHTFDCWVKITRPNGSITAIKPYLVALIDIRSRSLVGWAICEMPNSQVIKKTMLHMIYPKKNTPIEGVPRVLLIDNGKDWTSKTLTGRNRTERFTMDAEIKGFYKGIGIEEDMRSLPYQAWTKGQIERFFRNVCDDFTSEFDSYTGTLTGSKTIGKVKKNIKKMLEDNQLYEIDEFAEKFDKWLNEEYHHHTHRGLKDQKEVSPKPIDVFMNGERYYKAAPPIEYAQMLLMKCEERLVSAVGFNLFNRNFQHQDLAMYIDKRVNVRYSPDNLDKAYVWSLDGIKICEVESFEGLHPIAQQNDETLINHLKDQKRQLRNTKGGLKFLQSTYEERMQAAAERKVLLPELTGETPQVTTLPNDRQYKEEIKQRKKVKEQKSEYLNQQGAKALAALARLEKVEGI